MNEQNFGPHLYTDATVNNSSNIDDLDYIFMFMNFLPEKIGMTKITQPYIFRYSGLNPDDCGITGMVIIAESHISIHTFTKKNYIFLDIFSCKYFNYLEVVEIFKNFFNVKTINYKIVQRGIDFPR